MEERTAEDSHVEERIFSKFVFAKANKALQMCCAQMGVWEGTDRARLGTWHCQAGDVSYKMAEGHSSYNPEGGSLIARELTPRVEINHGCCGNSYQNGGCGTLGHRQQSRFYCSRAILT